MPTFHHNLLGIGEFCDAVCKVIEIKISITIFDNKGETVITGWRYNNGQKLWDISLLPNEDDSCVRNKSEQTTLEV